MAEYNVTADASKIDFGASGTAEVLQNVRTILNTLEYSVPMDRNFAWSPEVDAPINVAQARTTARIITAIQNYEPRARVVSIKFAGDGLNGVLNPIVRISITEGGTTS